MRGPLTRQPSFRAGTEPRRRSCGTRCRRSRRGHRVEDSYGVVFAGGDENACACIACEVDGGHWPTVRGEAVQLPMRIQVEDDDCSALGAGSDCILPMPWTYGRTRGGLLHLCQDTGAPVAGAQREPVLSLDRLEVPVSDDGDVLAVGASHGVAADMERVRFIRYVQRDLGSCRIRKPGMEAVCLLHCDLCTPV